VFQADSLQRVVSMMSNTVRQSFRVPRPVDSPQGYAEALATIVDEHQIDWLIPTCEEVFFISAYRQLLNCGVLTDDFDKLARIHNKWTFSEFAGNSHAAVPETRLVEDEGGFDPFRDELQNWVFKPAYSRFASTTLISPSADELKQATPTVAEPWVAQRRIRGTEYSTYSIAREGRLVAHVTYQSLYRIGLGSGICFQPMQLPVIEEFVSAFVKDLNYTGQIGFDIICDPQDQYWVIEGNPRATNGAQLFARADALDRALLLEGDDVLRPSTNRLAMIEFAMPLWGLSHAIRNRKLLRFLPDLLRSRWLTFSLADPLPALGVPASLWEIVCIARQKQLTLQQAATCDMEWNGSPM